MGLNDPVFPFYGMAVVCTRAIYLRSYLNLLAASPWQFLPTVRLSSVALLVMGASFAQAIGPNDFVA
jgi:hypothetical protein